MRAPLAWSAATLAILTACGRKTPTPEPEAARSAAPVITATATASAAENTREPAPPLPSASADAPPAEPPVCAAIATFRAPKIQSECPIKVAPSPAALPGVEWQPCAPDVGLPQCRAADGRGVLFIDAAAAKPTVARTVSCREGTVFDVAEIDGKVLTAAAFSDLPYIEGSCSWKLVAHNEDRWMIATEYHKEGFSWRTDSPGLTLLGGPVRGPITVIARDSEATPQHAFVDAKGFAYDAVHWHGWRWGEQDSNDLPTPFGSSGDWAFGGGALFYISPSTSDGVLLIPLGGKREALLPPGVFYKLAADAHDLVFTAQRRRTEPCSLFTATVPATAADLAVRRLPQPCASPMIIGCGHALLGGDKRLTLVRLGDGAEASIEAPGCDPKTKRGCFPRASALSCTEAFFEGKDVYRVPLTAFGKLVPPATAPVAVDAANLFDTPDGGVGDGGTSDAGVVDAGAAVDAGVPVATDAGAKVSP